MSNLIRYAARALLLGASLAAFTPGCTTAPKSQAGRDDLRTQADSAREFMMSEDASFKDFMAKAYGQAVFPSVGKGGVGLGGAYGRGIVYAQGKPIGYADLSQATIGFQLGGQSYKQIIAFENKAALDRFTQGNFAFSANASAVALTAGAGAAAKYTDGVAVFIHSNGGLMYEASIGGQKFSYQPF